MQSVVHPVGKGKVVIIGTAYPLRGGLASYNERLARAFIDSGYQAVIYTFRLQYPSFLFPGKTQYDEGPAPPGLDIHITINSIWPPNWIRMARRIRNENPDLVIIKYWLPFMAPCFGTMARIIRKRKDTRIISILDNVIPHEKHPGNKLLARYFLNSIDGCVGMSDSVLKDLLCLSPHMPNAYCPHPLYDNYGEAMSREEAVQHLGLDPSFRYLLFFGFIREYKGLDLLLHAFASLRKEHPDLRLLVAGEYYTDAGSYQKIIEENSMQSEVLMHTHYIQNQKVADYFCACDLVVQPYRSATQSGITQIAYHFEKPMVVTNTGGLAEMVKDGRSGYVVDPNVSSIAQAIRRFFDEDRSIAFTSAVREDKKNFSWERMIQAVEQVSTISKKRKI
jgi:D-inositol-3-phosphate glycosyltransferase